MSKLTLITLWAMRMWLGAICLFALVLIWRHVDNQNGWVLGDWMIDYRQGFVRRGLSGTVAQFLSEFCQVRPSRLSAASSPLPGW